MELNSFGLKLQSRPSWLWLMWQLKCCIWCLSDAPSAGSRSRVLTSWAVIAGSGAQWGHVQLVLISEAIDSLMVPAWQAADTQVVLVLPHRVWQIRMIQVLSQNVLSCARHGCSVLGSINRINESCLRSASAIGCVECNFWQLSLGLQRNNHIPVQVRATPATAGPRC